MNRSQVIFFFAVLAVVIAIARYNSRSTAVTQSSAPSAAPSSTFVPASPAAPPSAIPIPAPTTAPQLSQNQSAQFRKVAAQVAPAIILISVFDSSGRLLRNGTGFFVSEDGRFVTSRSVMEGGAHAVAKTSDGRIHNVSGILANGGTLDLVILNAQPKQRVPFLSVRKTTTDQGLSIAVIGNPLTGRDSLLAGGKISTKRSDQSGESFELSMPIPNEIGSPVVNEGGEVVGIVTQGAQDAKGNIVRAASALNSLLAQIDPEAKIRSQLTGNSLEESPASPSDGLSPRKTQIPLAGTKPVGNSRLIYTPVPTYPDEVRNFFHPVKGSGRFRVTFAPNGEVRDVAVIQSTRNATLDNAAVEALRRWKAQPGQEWTANVPITFQP
jgi:TonB family protein